MAGVESSSRVGMKRDRYQLQDASIAANRLLKGRPGLVRGKGDGRDRPPTVLNRDGKPPTDSEFRGFVKEANLILAHVHAVGAEPPFKRFRLLMHEHDDGIESFVMMPEIVLRPANRI